MSIILHKKLTLKKYKIYLVYAFTKKKKICLLFWLNGINIPVNFRVVSNKHFNYCDLAKIFILKNKIKDYTLNYSTLLVRLVGMLER